MCVSSFGKTPIDHPTLPQQGTPPPAPQIGATLKILDPINPLELTTLRVGQTFRVAVTGTNLNLIANQNVSLSYVLSVTPTGITTPIVLSGTVATKLTLPGPDGAAQTTEGLSSLSGNQSAESFLTVPDFMPTGTATLTITFTTAGLNTITLQKSITIPVTT